MTKDKYAQIVFGLPLDKAFTYSIPQTLRTSIELGQRVEVPFGQRNKIGYVVDFLNQSQIPGIKPVNRVIDQQPLLDRQMLKLTRRIADYYCASWGEVIEASCPASLRKRKTAIEKVEPLNFLQAPEKLEQKRTSLSAQQKHSLKLIINTINKGKHQVFLLHGITASGKTEVYLQAIACVLRQGKSAIVLVPEIALTAQTVDRFHARFGQNIALLHSRLSAKQRGAEWRRIKSGQARIIIGARSAVFAPVKNLGLIVVDEEHETTYKQKESAPRYHAREVAILRAKLASASVILGSATPSLESFYTAQQGRWKLICLPQRVTQKALPQVTIIDMRQERVSRKRKINIFSRALEVAIREALGKGEQVILFLNRRGFATFIHCFKCGYVAKCKRCNVALTYHYARKELVCHYCNYSRKPPQICPQCQAAYLSYFGLGTEKVESELHRLFPQARISRMDTDVTAKADAHRQILQSFKQGQIDILVGTQMVAKGLDFPRVSLVGVVAADTALNLPDFRSGERTFNLLTQVGGRAGRGQAQGQVIIQTYVPQHYAIAASVQHDYQQFYRKEIKSRRQLKLPPFAHLVNLTLRSRNQKRVQAAADDLSLRLKKKKSSRNIQILGPAADMISRMRGSFRFNILLKGKNVQQLVKLLKRELNDFTRYQGVILTVDVDPI